MDGGDDDKAAMRACLETVAHEDSDVLDRIVSPGSATHDFTEGDYVATRWFVRGRHQGELMGTSPSGREIAFSGVTISRCRDGKIVEEWEICDTLGLLQQIGALPAPEER
jgi:SnoaL-like polyketide cyclase